jgi:DNA invertase Pin-like site-specific DNA recombinase
LDGETREADLDGVRGKADDVDDGGYSGGNTDRPGLKRLLEDVEKRLVDTIVVYKVDRLTHSLSDFAKIVEALRHTDFPLCRSPSSSTPPHPWEGLL